MHFSWIKFRYLCLLLRSISNTIQYVYMFMSDGPFCHENISQSHFVLCNICSVDCWVEGKCEDFLQTTCITNRRWDFIGYQKNLFLIHVPVNFIWDVGGCLWKGSRLKLMWTHRYKCQDILAFNPYFFHGGHNISLSFSIVLSDNLATYVRQSVKLHFTTFSYVCVPGSSRLHGRNLHKVYITCEQIVKVYIDVNVM